MLLLQTTRTIAYDQLQIISEQVSVDLSNAGSVSNKREKVIIVILQTFPAKPGQ